jgi:hypothetical protein
LISHGEAQVEMPKRRRVQQAVPKDSSFSDPIERSEQPFYIECGRELGTDGLEAHQRGYRRWLVRGVRPGVVVPFSLYIRDLTQQQLNDLDLAEQLCPEAGRQRPTVPCPQFLKARTAIPFQRFVVHDPLARQQSLDAIDVPDPLTQQDCALPAGASAIFLIRGRRYHHRANARLTSPPGKQRSQQSFPINDVGLRATLPPGHRDRRGIYDMVLDLVRLKQPMHPEPVEAGLLDDGDPNRTSGRRFRL